MSKKYILTIIMAFCLGSTFAEQLESSNLATTKTESSLANQILPIPTPAAAPAAKPVNSVSLKPVNKIVAYVNKRIITQNELSNQMVQARFNLSQRGIKDTNNADLKNKVLEQMIMQQIQLDLAQRGGIRTSDAEVNDAIAANEKAQKITDDQMRKKLASQGLSYDDFRSQMRDQITIEKLKQREVDGRVVINEDEVTRILNSETYKNKIDYRLADIVINMPEQATQEIITQKQKQADMVYQLLKQGQSFDQMAIKYSSAPNALAGGDLGWKSNTSLPPIILNQLTGLKQGEITQVIKLPIGFFIFKVNGIKQHGTPQIVRQYNVRHILIKVNELTSDDEAHQKINDIRAKIVKYNNDPARESQEFVALAKQYSEDTSSLKGGDIGWVSKGDTVPQFEHAMLTTPIGQISQPIRSPFGWHILEVMDTRDSNLANDKEKAEIRMELRDTKAQMLYTEWVRNLKEMAYVKINDD